MCIQYLVKFCQFFLKITGHNAVTNLRKIKHNNPKVGLVKINVHTKFGVTISIFSQVTEKETKFWHQSRAHRKNSTK